MFKSRFKKVVVSTLALIMVIGTVAMASGVRVENIPATYGRIKIQNEGIDVTSQIESKYGSPAFVSGGRSYVPVRAIADVLGVKVDWDGSTHTANFTNIKEKALQIKLNEKIEEIAKLEKEIQELKEGTVSKGDLTDLEKDLNKEFKDFENLEFKISLKDKGKDKVEVDINTDLRNSRDERVWNNLSTSKKEGLIKDIVSAIQKEFKNADVEGRVYDSYNRQDLYTFSKTSSGSIKINSKDFDARKVEDYFREALEEDFDYEAKMKVKAKVTYNERRQEIKADVTFDSSDDRLATERIIDSVIANIDKEINSRFEKMTVEVDLYDGKVKVGDYYNGVYKEIRK